MNDTLTPSGSRLVEAMVLRAPYRLSALFGLVVLAGCAGMTQPEDVAVAEELCAKRGGFTHVSRYERGAHVVINCKDGTHIEVRLPKKAETVVGESACAGQADLTSDPCATT